MIAALILVPRLGGDPEEVVLNGRTERGQRIQMVLQDGKLFSFKTQVAVWCPRNRAWGSLDWSPQNSLAVDFEHDGSRFYVREDSKQPDADPPLEVYGVMRGEVGDGGRSASGTIRARATWGTGARATTCRSSLSFSAR